MTVAELSPAELNALLTEVRGAYDAFKTRGLKLDMTRGKPAPEQLDLANGLLALPGNGDYFSDAREDGRNYGGGYGGYSGDDDGDYGRGYGRGYGYDQDYAGRGGIVLYQDAGFSGRSIALDRDEVDLGRIDFNDKASSVSSAASFLSVTKAFAASPR